MWKFHRLIRKNVRMSKKAPGVFPGMLLLALILIFKENVTHICGTYRGAVLSFSEFTGVK